MPSETTALTLSLAERESAARALMRGLRKCGRDLERLAARAGAASGHEADQARQRVRALKAEADHIKLELASWDVARSRLWTEQLQERLQRLTSAIAAAPESDPPRVRPERVRARPGSPKRERQVADEVERTIYDYLYPRRGGSAACG
jgi:hypothetical protein